MNPFDILSPGQSPDLRYPADQYPQARNTLTMNMSARPRIMTPSSSGTISRGWRSITLWPG